MFPILGIYHSSKLRNFKQYYQLKKYNYHYGPKIDTSNAYPQKYNFLLNTRQQHGACLTATEMEGAYTTAGYYNVSLIVGSPLTLDIYSDNDSGEKYNFRYIAVDIHYGL